MAHTFTQLHLHVVFSTWDRQPSIREEIRQPLYSYIGGVIRNAGSRSLIVNGVDDHVHLLLAFEPTTVIADLVARVKSRSSGWLNRKHPTLDFRWQGGYSAFSVSHSRLDEVYRYIARQEEHHRKKTFDDELAAILRLAGLDTA